MIIFHNLEISYSILPCCAARHLTLLCIMEFELPSTGRAGTDWEHCMASGESSSIKMRPAPGSLCSVGVVDKSELLMGGNKKLTLDKVA